MDQQAFKRNAVKKRKRISYGNKLLYERVRAFNCLPVDDKEAAVLIAYDCQYILSLYKCDWEGKRRNPETGRSMGVLDKDAQQYLDDWMAKRRARWQWTQNGVSMEWVTSMLDYCEWDYRRSVTRLSKGKSSRGWLTEYYHLYLNE